MLVTFLDFSSSKFQKLNKNFKFNFLLLILSWVSPLLSLGKERPLKEEDLYSPVPNEESKHLTEQLEK